MSFDVVLSTADRIPSILTEMSYGAGGTVLAIVVGAFAGAVIGKDGGLENGRVD